MEIVAHPSEQRALDLIAELVMLLWHASEGERTHARELAANEEDFWNLDLLADRLAGWCSRQGDISPEEASQLSAMPRLDIEGDFGAWLRLLEGSCPNFYCYVSALDLQRRLLIEAVRGK